MTTAAASTQTTTTTAPPPGAAAGGKPDGAGAGASEGAGKAGETSPNTTTALGGAANGAAQPGSTEPAKTDGKPAEAKPGESQAELELKFPDGFKADTELLDGFKALAKETGLKGEHAQKLADFYVKAQEKLNDGGRAAWEKQHQDWREAQKADKEIGGANLKQNLTVADQAVAKFGDQELRELFKSPLGDHPAFVRFAYRVGKALQEDSSQGTRSGGSKPTSSQDDLLRDAYPTMFQEKE